MRVRRWLALALALCLWAPALSALAEIATAQRLPAAARIAPVKTESEGRGSQAAAFEAGDEAVISAPVEAVPLELEAALPGPEAQAGPAQVRGAEALAPGLEVIIEPVATAAPGKKHSAKDAVELNATDITLGAGESFRLKVASDAGGASVSFRSTEARVATVSSTGKITGVKKGSAVVTATLSDGRNAACRVTVKAAPISIELNATDIRLGCDTERDVGSQYRLRVRLPEGAASGIRYSGYDPAVVSVSDNGNITAVGLGTTTVTASTFNGLRARAKVTVLFAPKKVALNRTELALFPGETYRLKASLPEDTAGSVTFATSDPGVAAVGARSGRVTAVGRGSAVITATTFNGRVAACTVEVGYAPEKIALAKKKITLGVGETFALDARPLRKSGKPAGGVVRCASSSAAAAVRDGVVTGVKPGKATVTVRTANGVKAVCKVTVKAAPKSVTLTAASPKLTVGEKTKLKARLSPDSASALTWSGYDPSVIEVSAQGQVRAVGPGQTRVTVTTYNGLKAACTVRVYAKNRRQTQIIAHRGGAGDWPENSLEAFAHAAATGADSVELDVRTTRDDEQVVHHDPTFVIRGRRYTIENLSLAEIQALDPDICSLEEALEVISASGLDLVLEMKSSADPEACVRAVSRYGMERRVYYISFDDAKLKVIRALRPNAKVGTLFTQTPANLEQTLATLKPEFISQQASYLTWDNLIRWQSRGLLVGVWTVNDASQMCELLDMGVDYLTSDDPRLAAALADR
ncbi:MAG: Ig-like domain-containing protein [Clostridia bacterium]|nr:Ig-like domain-containing protein [Clostridia bacterium]